MVDKSVGTAGTLRITDDGTTVRFYVLCSDPATNVGEYRYAINGVWATTSLPSGFGSRLLAARDYATSRTVSLSQQATGTQGLGGADALIVAINRPKPTPPSGLTATRVSDTQQSLNWTRGATYTGVVVQRRELQGEGGSWKQIAAPSGNLSSYTDRSTKANHRYQYRVAGKAASGQSEWSNVFTIDTTPAAPTGVAAVRSGDDIVVSATGLPPYGETFDVQDGATVVASGVSLPWTDVDPNPAVPHTYQVRARTASGLAGPWSSSSNTVQLITPPNAPSGLAPNGGVAASDVDVVFRWTHNPVDSSAQSAYELQHREPGGAWTTLTGTTDETHAVTLPVGVVEWQVRTKGAHPDWSPWSATATATVIDRPGVAVLSPENSWDASTLPVEWSWFQEQGRPQSAWQAELVNGTGDTVETRSGSGAASTVTFNRRLTEGDWTVNVRAATGDVWSEWATASFTVTFVPPAPPVLDGVWDDNQGGVFLTVGIGNTGVAMLGEDGAWYAEFPAEGVSNVGFDDGHPYVDDGADEGWLFDGPQVLISETEPPATVNVILERSLDGDAWEPVAETADVASLLDQESWSYADIHYRATAFTAEGAASVSTVIVEARSGVLWLSGGTGFGVTCRLPFNPEVQFTSGRERALKQYAGRSLPVAYAGEAVSRVGSVSGMVMDRSDETATVEDMRIMSQLEEDRFLFRDPDGRRVYGTIGEIGLTRTAGTTDEQGFNAYWDYQFTFTETEQR